MKKGMVCVHSATPQAITAPPAPRALSPAHARARKLIFRRRLNLRAYYAHTHRYLLVTRIL